MNEEDGNGSEPERKAEPRACPVWVAGRCDGITCNCAARGGP